MSYLKQTINFVAMGLIVASLAACDDGGAFKAETLAVKDLKQNPILEAQRPVLTEEQIKALYAENQKKSAELQEEIALKNEVVTRLQMGQEESQNQIKALHDKVVEVIASDASSSDKVAELDSLKQQIASLKEQMNTDRAQYTEALESMNSNDLTLKSYLIEVREEINRLKSKQGTITDQEILDIEKRLSDSIRQVQAQGEGDRTVLVNELKALKAEMVQLEKDIKTIESVPVTDLPDQNNILAELAEKKERLSAVQDQVIAKTEELGVVENTILELKCVESGESCEYVKDDKNADAAATVAIADALEVQAEALKAEALENPVSETSTPTKETATATPAAESPVAEDSTRLRVTVTTDANGKQTIKTAQGNEELKEWQGPRTAEQLRKNSEALASAEESRAIIQAEVTDLKKLVDELKKEVEVVEGKQFDEITIREAATNDTERIASESRSRELMLEKNQLLDSIREANAKISNIQQGDLAQIDSHIVLIKKENSVVIRAQR